MPALPTRRYFLRLFLLYLVDWLTILGIIVFSASISHWASPAAHPFSPSDSTFSLPFATRERVTGRALIALAIILPGTIILLTTLLLPRFASFCSGGRSSSASSASSFSSVSSTAALRARDADTYERKFAPRAHEEGGWNWRRRARAFNTAWLGLGLSEALAMLFTDVLKNLVGRPRPDMLSRCGITPSLLSPSSPSSSSSSPSSFTSANVTAAAVGPLKSLVDWNACPNRFNAGAGGFSPAQVRDGFRSWPSGHSSISFAGLTYLALFLGGYVFAVRRAGVAREQRRGRADAGRHADTERGVGYAGGVGYAAGTGYAAQEESGEAPAPTAGGEEGGKAFAVLVSAVPVLLAAYIAASRYADGRHHAFDILCGATLGIVCAGVGWALYGAWCVREPSRHGRGRGVVGGAVGGAVGSGGEEAIEMQRRHLGGGGGAGGGVV